ncbi:autoinducer binding domain-containing protein [Piscinibacter koreensis]|uniref:Autoinducer binding domain-containing protein n=1 Tax=Piscinibacter koreensis TaxID=2742824 RepID=A0A7Y6TZB3_9BURK|nr:autoinducer binding domain-containing protein [Schlegelella koreensis]NUZ09123.1 autoinducer binding domain-containing protein [Schlegelella koreensis]
MSERQALSEAVNNPDLLPRFANIASRIPAAADGAEVGELLAEAVVLLGADAGAFASFMKDDEHDSSYRFILACDPAWCLEYENGACFMHDPWISYARHYSEPTLASRIVARTERERQVVAMARRYGFQSTLIVPAHSPQGLTRLGGLCIGSSQPAYFDGDGLAAVAFAATPLAMRLHEWQVAQLRRELLDRAQLSETDILLLRHARAGQRSKQSAAVLKVNPVSIDSHWQRLNARLGVNSRISAANMAAEYGVI